MSMTRKIVTQFHCSHCGFIKTERGIVAEEQTCPACGGGRGRVYSNTTPSDRKTPWERHGDYDG